MFHCTKTAKTADVSRFRISNRFPLIFLLLCSFATPLFSGGEPEHERKIFAHHMGSLNVGRGAMAWMVENPNLGDPRYSTGGDYRNYALAPREVNQLTLEESADLQIRRAMAIGIDGFAMDAWAGSQEARDFLDALFAVAEENNYPFELSITPDVNTLPQPDGYTAAVVEAIRYLLDNHGDSPNLARRDGKPIIFGYQSVFIWTDYLWEKYGTQEEVDRIRTSPEGWATISDAFRRIEELVGQELYFQFDFGGFFFGVQKHVPDHLHAEAAAAVARQLPAVNQFLPDRHTMEVGRAVVAEGAEWGHPIYMNYENNRTNGARGGPGTEELRQRWEEARELGSSLIQYTTWNDYQENTNISPGTTTRYAYYDLTGYFVDWWKSGSMPELDRDKVYIFSRRYGEDAEVFPFRSRYYHPGAIEVLTILREPATVSVPGRGGLYEAPAGMHAEQFPVTPGPVSAEVHRGGETVLSLESPEPVTARPFRQDNGIVAISSECERYWQQEFGNAKGLLYSEYGDDDGDGLPNWFEMYWFGEFNNYSTAVATTPDHVANEEGISNLEAYRDQVSPLGGDFDLEEPTGPFHGEPSRIPGVIQAEDYDFGGQGVAYNDTNAHNQGGAYRNHEGVDIQPTEDESGGFNVGWIAPGEWLEFTVEVEASGYYDLNARVACPFDQRSFHIQIDGENVTGPIDVPQTKGWQEWETVTVPDVRLEAGVRKMRIHMDTGDFNLNYVEFTRDGAIIGPQVGISEPEAGAIFSQGEDITIVADTQDANVVRVVFFAGDEELGQASAAPFRFTWKDAPAGKHELRVEAMTAEGAIVSSSNHSIKVQGADGAQREPFHGVPFQLPGRVLASDFDLGGQGVAYFDITDHNQGGVYRDDDYVDLERTGDVAGGYNVGWTLPSEWIAYTVEVNAPGLYDLQVRVATPDSGRYFYVDFDGHETSGRIDIPNTGGWQSWTTVTIPGVSLDAGIQEMRIRMGSGYFNLNYVDISPATDAHPLTFESWTQSHFSDSEMQLAEVSGDNADPDGDGVSNLMEYALGGNPRTANRSGLPETTIITEGGEAYLALEFTRPAGLSDIEYSVEVSEDLRNWHGGSGNVVLASITSFGMMETVLVRDQVPIGSGNGQRYIRLNVTRTDG